MGKEGLRVIAMAFGGKKEELNLCGELDYLILSLLILAIFLTQFLSVFINRPAVSFHDAIYFLNFLHSFRSSFSTDFSSPLS